MNEAMNDMATAVSANFDALAEGLRAGRLAPYLGPGALTLDGEPPFPASSMDLVQAITQKVAVPGRIRTNLWSSAQWIESNKHRLTLIRALQAIFAAPAPANRLHTWLAGLSLPLIVDTWYDTTMADALTASGRSFVQWQGIRRSGQTYEEPWGKVYCPIDGEMPASTTLPEGTFLYKPHGSIRPAANFLISDSDYVEVLTEIDIQTPIPPQVMEMRASLGFVFLGCRFFDQMQRTFAHQITKRSAGPLWAVIEGEMTRNEARFLETEGIRRIDCSLSEAVAALMAG